MKTTTLIKLREPVIHKNDWLLYFDKCDERSSIAETFRDDRGEIVSSNPIAGTTGISYAIEEYSSDSLLIRRTSDQTWIVPDYSLEKVQNVFQFQVTLNNEVFNFVLDLNEGKYIGISKLIDSSNQAIYSVGIIQARESFKYY